MPQLQIHSDFIAPATAGEGMRERTCRDSSAGDGY